MASSTANIAFTYIQIFVRILLHVLLGGELRAETASTAAGYCVYIYSNICTYFTTGGELRAETANTAAGVYGSKEGC